MSALAHATSHVSTFIGPRIETSVHERRVAFRASIAIKHRTTADAQRRAAELVAAQALRQLEEKNKALAADRAEQRLTAAMATAAAAREAALAARLPPPKFKTKVRQIQDLVCATLDVSLVHLFSTRRTRRIVRARQVAMLMCVEYTVASYPAIGRRFGGRDHTTVLHAHRHMAAIEALPMGTGLSHMWPANECDLAREMIAEVRTLARINEWDKVERHDSED